ncbi:hypothetical protein GCM10009722_18850 [Williamsia deligens]
MVVSAGGTVSDTGAEYGAAAEPLSWTRSMGRVTSAPPWSADPAGSRFSFLSAIVASLPFVFTGVGSTGGTHDGGHRT